MKNIFKIILCLMIGIRIFALDNSHLAQIKQIQDAAASTSLDIDQSAKSLINPLADLEFPILDEDISRGSCNSACLQNTLSAIKAATQKTLSIVGSTLGCGAVTVILQRDLPYTITKPGLYCLGEDVVFDPAPVITVAASNVVIDLNDKTIDMLFADGAVGIKIGNNSNIIIKNGTIKNTGFPSVNPVPQNLNYWDFTVAPDQAFSTYQLGSYFGFVQNPTAVGIDCTGGSRIKILNVTAENCFIGIAGQGQINDVVIDSCTGINCGKDFTGNKAVTDLFIPQVPEGQYDHPLIGSFINFHRYDLTNQFTLTPERGLPFTFVPTIPGQGSGIRILYNGLNPEKVNLSQNMTIRNCNSRSGFVGKNVEIRNFQNVVVENCVFYSTGPTGYSISLNHSDREEVHNLYFEFCAGVVSQNNILYGGFHGDSFLESVDGFFLNNLYHNTCEQGCLAATADNWVVSGNIISFQDPTPKTGLMELHPNPQPPYFGESPAFDHSFGISTFNAGNVLIENNSVNGWKPGPSPLLPGHRDPGVAALIVNSFGTVRNNISTDNFWGFISVAAGWEPYIFLPNPNLQWYGNVAANHYGTPFTGTTWPIAPVAITGITGFFNVPDVMCLIPAHTAGISLDGYYNVDLDAACAPTPPVLSRDARDQLREELLSRDRRKIYNAVEPEKVTSDMIRELLDKYPELSGDCRNKIELILRQHDPHFFTQPGLQQILHHLMEEKTTPQSLYDKYAELFKRGSLYGLLQMVANFEHAGYFRHQSTPEEWYDASRGKSKDFSHLKK